MSALTGTWLYGILEAETAALIAAQRSRSHNLRKSRQFLIGAVIGD